MDNDGYQYLIAQYERRCIEDPIVKHAEASLAEIYSRFLRHSVLIERGSLQNMEVFTQLDPVMQRKVEQLRELVRGRHQSILKNEFPMLARLAEIHRHSGDK